MGQKISKAGSTARQKIFEEWKSGTNSIWEIQINVEVFKKGLAKEKRKMEEKFDLEHSKRLKLEEELCCSNHVL